MVADFGIALGVSAAASGRMTETGLSLGTPHDMSPEQATEEKAPFAVRLQNSSTTPPCSVCTEYFTRPASALLPILGSSCTL